MLIKAVTDFLNNNSGDYYEIKDVAGFIERETNVVLSIKGQIIAVCLFAIENETANVFELTIKKEFRARNLVKYISFLGLKKFPFLRYVLFKRGRRQEKSKDRKVSLYRILGANNVKEKK